MSNASRYRELARRRNKVSRSICTSSSSVASSEISDTLTVETGLLGYETVYSSDSTVSLTSKNSQHVPNMISPTNDSTKNDDLSRLAKAEATILELRKELKYKILDQARCSGSCSCSCTQKLEKQVSVLNKTVNDLRNQLDQALTSAVTRSANISMLRVQNKALTDELEDSKQMVHSMTNLEEQIKTLQIENAELQRDDSLQNQKVELIIQSKRNRIMQLEKERDWMKECLDESKELRRTGREELDRTNKILNDLKSENESLKSKLSINIQNEIQLNDLRINLDELETAYESSKNEIRSFKVTCDEYEARVQKVSLELKHKDDELKKAKLIATNAFVKISELESQLEIIQDAFNDDSLESSPYDSEI